MALERRRMAHERRRMAHEKQYHGKRYYWNFQMVLGVGAAAG
jgi:hypothetical protein